jgi:hypothetical protein
MITDEQAWQLQTWPVFVHRVQLQLESICNNVYSEGTGVTGHAVRAARAEAILNNPHVYLPFYVLEVISQLNLASTNINGAGTDVDTTDAAITTALPATFNALASV